MSKEHEKVVKREGKHDRRGGERPKRSIYVLGDRKVNHYYSSQLKNLTVYQIPKKFWRLVLKLICQPTQTYPY